MSEDDRVRFDRIDYVTLGSDDVPVQRSCPTFYERFTDGRPASQFEFQASPEFFDLLPGWLANLAGAAPSSFRRRAALPRPGRHLPLDGWFNAEHADHLHAEGIGAPLLDKSARSATLFCQQVCNRVFGNALVSDGVWGDKTQAAMDPGTGPNRCRWRPGG